MIYPELTLGVSGDSWKAIVKTRIKTVTLVEIDGVQTLIIAGFK